MVLNLTGMAMFLLAMKENRFFSTVVRIQNDRGQTVCKTGPYGVIRHPGNAGMIIGTIGLPFLFMSVWSAIPVLLSVIIIIIRTHLEDILLKDELEGYCDYQRSTRFRLIPGIW
jgi:protein-S-isoprenylcysteine O-methyltransferase Ste14